MIRAKKRKRAEGFWCLGGGNSAEQVVQQKLSNGALLVHLYSQKRDVLVAANTLQLHSESRLGVVGVHFIPLDQVISGLLTLPDKGELDVLELDGERLPLTLKGVEALQVEGGLRDIILSMFESFQGFKAANATPVSTVSSICFSKMVTLVGEGKYLNPTIYPLDMISLEGTEERYLGEDRNTFLKYLMHMLFAIEILEDDIPEEFGLLFSGRKPLAFHDFLYLGTEEFASELLTDLKVVAEEEGVDVSTLEYRQVPVLDLCFSALEWIAANKIHAGWYNHQFVPYTKQGILSLISMGEYKLSDYDDLSQYVRGIEDHLRKKNC